MPQHVKAEHPTGLQKRLIDEVTSMMRANSKKLTDLARETGLGKSYLSLLLHGKRPGTMATWDLLLSTGKSWGFVVPQRLLIDGYDPKRFLPPLGDLDDSKRDVTYEVSGTEAGREGVMLPDDYFSVVNQGGGGSGHAAVLIPGLDCSIGDPEVPADPPEVTYYDGTQNPTAAPHTRNDVTGQPNRFRPLPKEN